MTESRTNTFTLSLISHTNVGKTALARTLLRRDVGESFDRAHVTEENESHILIETDQGDRLILWDTPGFGDSARLLRRLKQSEQKLAGFINQLWDRFTDRPLWCSQQAMRNVQDEADVVLYLVNASEDPTEVGYIDPEMEILAWIGKPVLVLLNQLGTPCESTQARQDEDEWRRILTGQNVVRGVLSLDAFTRCWVQEQDVIATAASLVPETKSRLGKNLAKAWHQRNAETFRKSINVLAAQLASSFADRERIDHAGRSSQGLLGFVTSTAGKIAGGGMTSARKELARRAGQRVQDALNKLITLHDIAGESAAQLEVAVHDQFSNPVHVVEGLWAVRSGIATGIVGGLCADAAAGGMTFGGGAVLGAIGGGAAAYALAHGYNLSVGGKNEVRWSVAHLHEQIVLASLSYLAIAHFGRGRGEWRDGPPPDHWRKEVDRAIDVQRQTIEALWKKTPEDTMIVETLCKMLDEILRGVLHSLYPVAEKTDLTALRS